MKREIKFRGKRLDNGEWIYGNLHIPNKLFTGIFICPDTTFGDIAPGMDDNDDFDKIKKYGCAIGHYHRIDSETVGEFTGLKDKNGVEIYEGDICKSNKETTSFVVWSLDGWRMNSYYDGGDMRLYSSLRDYGIEVIGNIYENPELL